MRQKSDLEAAFLTLWRQLVPYAPEPEREYRFHPRRRWRFDFAWPKERVAVELQGGIWTQGRHTRGSGYRNDCEKLNAAQFAGWRVFYITADMLEEDPVGIIDMIREVAGW